jgi:DHA1 family bicyclomycin/chloramphenicol resistance-like MFS transporter
VKRLSPNSLGFTLLIGALAGLPPLSTDMGLPGIRLLQASLGANAVAGALTISLFFAGYGAAQLVLGPLSDRIGRRPVLLGGMTLYTVAAAGSALSPSILILLACRFVQGLGAAGGTVLAFAIVRDVFAGAAGRAKLSTISMVFSIAPMVAPTLGGAMLLVGNWRAIYATMAGTGLVMTVCAALGLAESRRAGPRGMGFYAPVLRQRRSLGYALASALNGSSILAFITGSPLVLMDGMGLSPQRFGVVFAIITAGILGGSWVNARLVRRHVPAVWPLGFGLGLAAAAALGLCVVAAFGRSSLESMVPLLLLTTFCRGVIAPNAIHAALEPVPDHAGAAAAVIGSLQMLMGAFSGSVVGLLYPALGAGAMGVVMAGFAGAALMVWLVTESKR